MKYMVIVVNKKFLLVVVAALVALGAVRVAYDQGYKAGASDMHSYIQGQMNKYEKS